MSTNLYGKSKDFAWVKPLVIRYRPDVLVMQEYTEDAKRQLDGIREALPYGFEHVKPHVLGVAIYSRIPLRNCAKTWLAKGAYATLSATVEVSGQEVRVTSFHAPPPLRTEYYAARNAALDALPAWLDDDARCVVAGDFNTPMWSPHFRAMREDAGLNEARQGRGNCGTWPNAPWPLRIPIDHVLYRGALRCVGFQTAGSSGSDHMPVLAMFAFEQGS